MDADAARTHLLAEHRGTLATVLDCADAVADGWERSRDAARVTTDRDAVVGPLRVAMERAGILQRCPAMLRGAVAAGGATLQGDPVAAPPYVTVTSRGLVLRGTLGDGEGRLIVACEVFDVVRRPRRYVRGAATAEAALSVTVR